MTSVETHTGLDIEVHRDFDHLPVSPALWDRLLAAGPTDVVFLTHEWQRTWWETFGGDDLLIVTATRAGEPVAIAPLFAVDQMLFLVGSGGSDYLDFVGRTDSTMLAAMLDAARAQVPDFAGIGLYHVPLLSPTTSKLPGVASRLDLELHRDGGMTAPYVDLTDTARVEDALGRRKLRKDEARMRREGPLRYVSAGAADLDSWLDRFYSMHASRWSPEGGGGLEHDQGREFVRKVVHAGHRAGWLRFTMLEWKGQPAAFDISLTRGDRQLTYLVARDATITAYSPGKLLERQMMRTALESGARRFDFGLGDEPYKLMHASDIAEVANWFFYP